MPASPWTWKNIKQMKGNRAETLAWSFVVAAFALTFGLLNFYKLEESDLFWQLRAGAEILSTFKVQTRDSWSYTVAGGEWINFQWLETVLVYLVSKLTRDLSSLTVLRATLAAVWSVGLAVLIRITSGVAAGWVLTLLLLPLAYFSSVFRFQMRPDLFCIPLFTWLLVALHSGLSPRTKRSIALAALVLWSNLHAGTAPVGITVVVIWILADVERSARAKAAWIAGAIATWFFTPQGFRVVNVITENVFLYDQARAQNPDLQPFRLALVTEFLGGWNIILWALFTVFASFAAIYTWFEKFWIPEFQSKRWFVFIGGAVLTIFCLKMIRAIPYQVVFLSPLFAYAVTAFFRAVDMWPKKFIAATGVAFLLVTVWLIPDYARYSPHVWGTGVSRVQQPVASTRFLLENHPAKNLWNSYVLGGYLILNAPEYPVSIDGRDLPYVRTLKPRAFPAMNNPALYNRLMDELGVNTVMESIPRAMPGPGGALVDQHDSYFPRDKWALVFFDNVATVYLRRIPEHQRLIDRFEYKVVRRGFPAVYAAGAPAVTSDLRQQFEHEFDRCLALMPDNTYCKVGKGALLSRAGRMAEARMLLEQAVQDDGRNREAIAELANLYVSVGEKRLEEKMAMRLKSIPIE